MSPGRRDAPADHQRQVPIYSLVADSANQQLLSTWFDSHPQYTHAVGEFDSTPFDLCILDAEALDRMESDLATRKREDESLLPYLLLVPVGRDEAVHRELRQQRPELWQLIDGVVHVPTTKQHLADRVDTLLQLRWQSEAIVSREQQLELLNRVLRHDIRNDMAVILGWISILRENADEDERDVIARVEAASNRVTDLTTVARDIVEAMTTDDDVDLEPVWLTDVLTEEVEKCQQAFGHATIDLPDALPPVTVRANDLLGSLFRNLLNNAVLHNNTDAPAVRVTLSVDEHDDFVTVRVADDGPGVPEAIRQEIFDDGVKGLSSGGTGMGLFLVQTLVDSYDGDVYVEDNDPRGAVFVVELPLAG